MGFLPGPLYDQSYQEVLELLRAPVKGIVLQILGDNNTIYITIILLRDTIRTQNLVVLKQAFLNCYKHI